MSARRRKQQVPDPLQDAAEWDRREDGFKKWICVMEYNQLRLEYYRNRSIWRQQSHLPAAPSRKIGFPPQDAVTEQDLAVSQNKLQIVEAIYLPCKCGMVLFHPRLFGAEAAFPTPTAEEEAFGQAVLRAYRAVRPSGTERDSPLGKIARSPGVLAAWEASKSKQRYDKQWAGDYRQLKRSFCSLWFPPGTATDALIPIDDEFLYHTSSCTVAALCSWQDWNTLFCGWLVKSFERLHFKWRLASWLHDCASDDTPQLPSAQEVQDLEARVCAAGDLYVWAYEHRDLVEPAAFGVGDERTRSWMDLPSPTAVAGKHAFDWWWQQMLINHPRLYKRWNTFYLGPEAIESHARKGGIPRGAKSRRDAYNLSGSDPRYDPAERRRLDTEGA